MAIGCNGTPNRIGQLGEDVWSGIVSNGMNRIQTQSIEMIFVQPIE